MPDSDVKSLPGGEEYDAAALRPRQHIHRAINPRWSATNRTRVSKFTLLRYQHDGVAFWSVTDLLGLFLSSLGSAPTGATKRNFYLPLTAVYGKWCSILIRTDPSFVVQCTWREAPGERARFFLGASMAGHEIDTGETGSWGHVLNRARYNIICSELLKLKGWSQRVSPDIQAWGGKRGKQFGTCSETYPLRFLLWSV